VTLPDEATRQIFHERLAPLESRFTGAGHRLYLVGGIVRDLLAGRSVAGSDADIDLTTDATPDVTFSLVQPWADTVWQQGARFGTIGARKGALVVEITTHRAERYRAESRHPDVDFSTRIDDDLSRRDFTVNAMALELSRWELIDPFDGRRDLGAGILRTPIDPAASFTDDPLRMLRAARFVAGYGLEPTGDLEQAMTQYRDRLAIVSRERIAEEFRKFLRVDRPGSGIELLDRTGVIDEVMPVARTGLAPSAALDATPVDLGLRWAVMLWAWAPEGGRPSGRSLATIRESGDLQSDTDDVLRAMSVLDDATFENAAALRRVLVTAGDALNRARLGLSAVGRGPDDEQWQRLSALAALEPPSTIRSPLGGHEVMELLGCTGPEVGRALAWLLEERIREGPLLAQEAANRLREWWDGRSD